MPRPLIIFAPGAGAPSSSKWMQRWAERLAVVGDVVRVDYPYMLAGRRSPDPLPKLIAAHREALAKARAGREGPVVLAGKSMGGRVGCHVSLEEPVSGVVCFGYPLKGAGKAGALRDAVLLQMRAPILFLQGTRDPLCPLDVLESVRPRMAAPNDLHVVEGGDHSLEVAKSELRHSGETQDTVEERILARVAAFVEKLS
ncbi:MAG TPA: alpha/beta fold hydrolase [Polyangiaceae bacterium]|nr:alpha/beta fold hydrolase [Polyangiaceae bacterium]